MRGKTILSKFFSFNELNERVDRMHSNNQKMFFERLEGKERSNDMIPDANEAKTFWKENWEKEIEQNGSNQSKKKFMIRHTSSVTIVFLLSHSGDS